MQSVGYRAMQEWLNRVLVVPDALNLFVVNQQETLSQKLSAVALQATNRTDCMRDYGASGS